MFCKKHLSLSAIALFLILVFAGCKQQDLPKIPAPGTKVTSESVAFRQLAGDLQDQCERMGGCTCYIDGIRTTCSVVFACLDAGFCKLVATE